MKSHGNIFTNNQTGTLNDVHYPSMFITTLNIKLFFTKYIYCDYDNQKYLLDKNKSIIVN